MSTSDETPAGGPGPVDGPGSPPPGGDLASEVAETESGAREVTVFPREASGGDLMERWITVREAAVVDLDAVR